MGKKFMGLDGTDHFWDRAKAWILNQITSAVTAMNTQITENKNNIAANTSDISALNTQITENKNNIAANTSDISALKTSVAGKADKAHTHTKSEITDLPDTNIDKQSVIDMVYPVGSLYWSSKDTDPSTLFGGTWVQIKDKFVLACGDTYKTVDETGGASSVTLSVSNMPSHSHSFTPSGEVSSHSHTINSGNTSSAGTKTTAGIRHSGSTDGMSANSTGSFKVINYGTSARKGVVTNVTGMLQDDASTNMSDTGAIWGLNNICVGGTRNYFGYHTISINVSHTHTLPSSYIYGNTETTTPTFTGNDGTTSSNGSGSAFNILPPYVVKYCWERTA